MRLGSQNQNARAQLAGGNRQQNQRHSSAASLDAARARLLAGSSEGVTDAELLALWLGLRDAGPAAHILCAERTLVGLLNAPPERLRSIAGLGRARVARLLAASALFDRAQEADLKAQPALSSSRAVRRFLRLRLGREPREVFACLFLDNRHRLIRFEPLFFGTLDRASVHPREVLRRVLELNAAAVILAHNHPSGIAEPSASDLSLTDDLIDLLRRIDVRVLDHLVIGRGTEVSFAERGFIRGG